jgi:LPS-assembly lipoprotein
VEIKREYFNNQQDIVAKDNEQQVIRNEMLQQAVRIMLDRIRLSLATDKK